MFLFEWEQSSITGATSNFELRGVQKAMFETQKETRLPTPVSHNSQRGRTVFGVALRVVPPNRPHQKGLKRRGGLGWGRCWGDPGVGGGGLAAGGPIDRGVPPRAEAAQGARPSALAVLRLGGAHLGGYGEAIEGTTAPPPPPLPLPVFMGVHIWLFLGAIKVRNWGGFPVTHH